MKSVKQIVEELGGPDAVLGKPSTYHFHCVCGEDVISSKAEGTCPHCGQEFELRRADYVATPEPKEWPTL